MPDPSAIEQLALAVSDQLDLCGIPHALGGALAYTYYGRPRQTMDVDFNVFLGDEDGERTVACLEPLGVEYWNGHDLARLKREGQVRLRCGPFPVDLFFAYHQFHAEAHRRSRMLPFAGRKVRMLAAEDLVVFKVIFNRPRDWPDIEEILKVQGGRFDADYALKWLGTWLEEDDSRLDRLREMAVRYGATGV